MTHTPELTAEGLAAWLRDEATREQPIRRARLLAAASMIQRQAERERRLVEAARRVLIVRNSEAFDALRAALHDTAASSRGEG